MHLNVKTFILRWHSESLICTPSTPLYSKNHITLSDMHQSHCLWNQVPDSFRQPRPHLSPPDSSLFPGHVSLPISASPLTPSIIPALFHSRLKTSLFHKSYTFHRPLVHSGLISRITWLFIGFPCLTVLFLFQFFRFQFSKLFSSSVILVPYSYLLVSAPLLVCFLVNQPHYHRFSVFRFHRLLVLTRYRLNWQVLSVFECNLCILSYRIVPRNKGTARLFRTDLSDMQRT